MTSTSTTPPSTDHGLARWLAWQAGQRLMALRLELGHANRRALQDAGDRRAHEFITGALARWRPSDAVLSEEGADDLVRLGAERVWIVDPLDGTREFGEHDRPDWAVHVGLWCRGKLVAGAVALPARDRIVATDIPPQHPSTGDPRSIRIAVSRSRPPVFLAALETALGRVVFIPIGSAGAKIVAVMDGDVDAYVHVGELHEWDFAAPVAVATAAGLHASRFCGAGLVYNRPDPVISDLVVCRKDLAGRLLLVLGDHAGT